MEDFTLTKALDLVQCYEEKTVCYNLKS